MSDEEFSALVAEAIDAIPDHYQEKMKSVAIVIADEPNEAQKRSLRLQHGASLYGLYEGVPLPKRGGATLTIPPDVITIFKYPMVHIYTDKAALKKQIFKTVWHEVAHYFGLDHDQIDTVSKRRTQ